MKSGLDAEGSDRYLFDQDFKPAINSTLDWLVILFNSAFADKKLSEEDLRDLTTTNIWHASAFARIKFDDTAVGHKLWTILGVFPEPVVEPVTVSAPLANNYDSQFEADLSYISSDFSASRITGEEWNQNKKNIFMPGNESVTNQLKKYAYLGFTDYSSSVYPTVGEIEVRPKDEVADKFVGLWYLRVPAKIDDIGDDIEFPETIIDLIWQKALNFIAYKQGDQTTLYQVTERDVLRLVQLMT